MTKWLIIPVFAVSLWAQPAALDAETVRTVFRFPRALEASTAESPFEIPETLQEKVVWERHFIPAVKGSVDSISSALMRSPALLTKESLDQMDQAERNFTEMRESMREQLTPEEAQKLEAQSPFMHFSDGRRVVVFGLPGHHDGAGMMGLLFSTADGQYEFFAQADIGGSTAIESDPAPELWKNYDWISEFKRAAVAIDAILSGKKQ